MVLIPIASKRNFKYPDELDTILKLRNVIWKDTKIPKADPLPLIPTLLCWQYEQQRGEEGFEWGSSSRCH
jgi:hypothetical protein